MAYPGVEKAVLMVVRDAGAEERTLVVSGERIPLYEEGGLRHVTIHLEEDALSTELRGLLDE